MNLDDWLISHEDILQSFWRHAADADLCIVDGVAGLIDGRWERWVSRPQRSLQLLALDAGQSGWAMKQSQHTLALNDLCGMHNSSVYVSVLRSPASSVDGLVATSADCFGCTPRRDGKTAGSTAVMAKLLGAPVLFVVDCSSASLSGAAAIKGVQAWDPDLRLEGVLLNKVAGEPHKHWICEALHKTDIQAKVLGGIPLVSGPAVLRKRLCLQQDLTCHSSLAWRGFLIRWLTRPGFVTHI